MTDDRATTGKVYAEYGCLIRRVERWVASQNPVISGCDDRHVRARLVQRVVELTDASFSRQAIEKHPEPVARTRFDADGVRICAATGTVSLSAKRWAAHLVEFVAWWVDALLRLLSGAVVRGPARSIPASVLMEAGGGYEDCDDRFIRFCRLGPIGPLAAAQLLIVRAKASPRRPTSADVMYSSRPIVHLVNRCLTASARRTVLARHLTAPYRYLRALLASPLNVLVSRDLSTLPVVEWLGQAGLLETIVITTSAYGAQPLWMTGLVDQKFKLHMIWYSQNFIPKMYVGETERQDLPGARHMRVDVHWVWTNGFRDYLASFDRKWQIRVVGPILWYLPEPIQTDPGVADVKVAVFDITPLPDGTTAFGAAKNYYSVACMSRFVADIVSTSEQITAATGKRVLLLLKHKRPPKPGRHDSAYLAWLNELVSRNRDFRLVDPQTNLFGLLQECDLSVSVPYTSTAYVGDALSKPALYYDPFAELVPRYEETPFVHFASGPEELHRMMVRLCASCGERDVADRVEAAGRGAGHPG